MNRWQDKLVMITQGSLFELAGSEVVTYEVAQYFSAAGAAVVVVTHGYSQFWFDTFAALDTVTLMRVDDPLTDRTFEERQPDLAWVHHQLIPEPVLRQPDGTVFIFHHMSSFQPQEFPLAPAIGAALASVVLFPATGARDAQVESGLLNDVEPDRLMIFGNPAPDAFAAPERPDAGSLSKLLVVSNHVPPEAADAIARLGSSVETVKLGSEDPGGSKHLVQPSDIHGVDAVLTIGKTVQYALVAGVPVYCYDHFGGPGWLSPANFAAARDRTFSGRGFAHKSADQIVDELQTGFSGAETDARELRDGFGAEFLMDSAMERLFADLTPVALRKPADQEIEAFLLRQKVATGLTNALAARTQTIEYQSEVIAGLQAQIRTITEAPSVPRRIARRLKRNQSEPAE